MPLNPKHWAFKLCHAIYLCERLPHWASEFFCTWLKMRYVRLKWASNTTFFKALALLLHKFIWIVKEELFSSSTEFAWPWIYRGECFLFSSNCHPSVHLYVICANWQLLFIWFLQPNSMSLPPHTNCMPKQYTHEKSSEDSINTTGSSERSITHPDRRCATKFIITLIFWQREAFELHLCSRAKERQKLSQYLTAHELARQTGQTQTTGLRGECGNVEALKRRRACAIIPDAVRTTRQTSHWSEFRAANCLCRPEWITPWWNQNISECSMAGQRG